MWPSRDESCPGQQGRQPQGELPGAFAGEGELERAGASVPLGVLPGLVPSSHRDTPGADDTAVHVRRLWGTCLTSLPGLRARRHGLFLVPRRCACPLPLPSPRGDHPVFSACLICIFLVTDGAGCLCAHRSLCPSRFLIVEKPLVWPWAASSAG